MQVALKLGLWSREGQERIKRKSKRRNRFVTGDAPGEDEAEGEAANAQQSSDKVQLMFLAVSNTKGLSENNRGFET